jgi:hypothetical protein
MKKAFLYLLLTTSFTQAQSLGPTPKIKRMGNWPFTVQLYLHSLSMPLRDFPTSNANVGIGLGTEAAYNQRGTFIQTVQTGYYHNPYAGDGFFVQTQAGYRPHIGPVYAEIKAGLGWHYSFHPNTTLQFREGSWQSAGRTGKGLLMVPVGLSVGYTRPASRLVPFVGYQIFALSGYNPALPVVPNQFLQAGVHLYLSN